jgi:hypothetical protein
MGMASSCGGLTAMVKSDRDRQREAELVDQAERNKKAKFAALYSGRGIVPPVDPDEIRRTLPETRYEISERPDMPPTPKFKHDDDLPNRLSGDEASAYYHPDCQSVGVKFDGRIRPNDVVEYCISEGWIKVQTRLGNGKIMMRHGKKYLRTWRGEVVPFLKEDE